MGYCPNCGTQVRDDQDVCLSCGKTLKLSNSKKAVQEEGSTTGYAVLGFFVPIVGLILFLIWKDDRPRASASAGKGALIGFILGIVIYVIFIAILASAGFYAY